MNPKDTPNKQRVHCSPCLDNSQARPTERGGRTSPACLAPPQRASERPQTVLRATDGILKGASWSLRTPGPGCHMFSPGVLRVVAEADSLAPVNTLSIWPAPASSLARNVRTVERLLLLVPYLVHGPWLFDGAVSTSPLVFSHQANGRLS